MSKEAILDIKFLLRVSDFTTGQLATSYRCSEADILRIKDNSYVR